MNIVPTTTAAKAGTRIAGYYSKKETGEPGDPELFWVSPGLLELLL